MTFLALFIATALHSSRAQAGDDTLCGNTTEDESTWIDLRQPGKSMYGLPVLDMDGKEYCYNYSGAELFAAYLNRAAPKNWPAEKRAKLLASPMVLANEARAEDVSGVQCPHVCDAVMNLETIGGCSADSVDFQSGGGFRAVEQPMVNEAQCVRWETPGTITDLEKSVEAIVDNSLNNYSNYSAAVEDIRKTMMGKFGWDSMHGLNRSRQNKAADFIAREVYDGEAAYQADQSRLAEASADLMRAYNAAIAPQCVDVDSSKNGDPEYAFHGNMNYGEVFGTSDPAEIQRRLPSCQYTTSLDYGPFCSPNRYPKTVVDPDSKFGMVPSDHRQFINSHLDGGNPLPVGVSMCWPFLLDGPAAVAESKTENQGCYRPYQTDSQSQGDHNLLVIGRRVDHATHQCQYLVRNSWGNDCNSYYKNPDGGLPDYYKSCLENLNGEYKEADLWVSAKVLTENTHGTESLQSKQ